MIGDIIWMGEDRADCPSATLTSVKFRGEACGGCCLGTGSEIGLA